MTDRIQVRISKRSAAKVHQIRKSVRVPLTIGQLVDLAIDSYIVGPPLVEIGKAEKWAK